jgi:hypothetical protein
MIHPALALLPTRYIVLCIIVHTSAIEMKVLTFLACYCITVPPFYDDLMVANTVQIQSRRYGVIIW